MGLEGEAPLVRPNGTFKRGEMASFFGSSETAAIEAGIDHTRPS